MIPATVPFVCIATGDFHGKADVYLNRLYSMLERHCSLPFTLTCFSDRTRKLRHDIQMLPATNLMETPPSGRSTRYKLGLFKADILPFEQFLYLDMSLVIRQDMTELLQFAFGATQDLVINREWSYDSYNSGVMRIRQSGLQTLHDSFLAGTRYPQRVDGDQDFIHAHIQAQKLESRVALFPIGQIVSYKRTRYLSEEGPEQRKRAQEIIDAATIVKFHGNPKMHHIAKRPRNIFKSLDSSLFKRETYENWR